MLVVEREVVLPDRCVHCNAPAHGFRLSTKLCPELPGSASLGVIGSLSNWFFASLAGTALTIDVKPSYLMQGVVGFDYMHRRGFTMIGAIGYARLLNSDNVEILDGTPKEEERMAIDVLFKSGAVVSMSFGYAWE